jgi:hypothetical protein
MNIYVLYQSEEEGSYTFFQEEDEINRGNLAKDAKLIWKTEAKSWEIACMKRNEFLGYEPYIPMVDSPEELKEFLPTDKQDIDNFLLLKNLGYPQIEPVLFELFEWIQDMNWPVAKEIAPYLASLGKSVKPHIERIFATEDGMWKYWTIRSVISEMPSEDKKEFALVLNQLLNSISNNDKECEVDLAALEVIQNM